jgi:ubiquinone/menaquinone biosynthesis C-methylase UbiE
MDNFDAMAKTFDTTRRIDRAAIIADKIRSSIMDGKSKTALEYGCGTGLLGLQLAGDFRELTLADSSHGMIEQVERKLAVACSPRNISTAILDVMVNLPDAMLSSCDYIFSSLVLHHITDTEEALRRLRVLLKDSGHLLIVDVDEEDGSFHAKYPNFDGHNGFNHQALIDKARKAGFKSAVIETFYHGSKSFNGKERAYSLFLLDAEK